MSSAAEGGPDVRERSTGVERIEFGGCPSIENALRIAAANYPKNRRKDALGFFYTTG